MNNSFLGIDKSFQKTPEIYGLDKCATNDIECLHYSEEIYYTIVPGRHVADLDAEYANSAIYDAAKKTGIIPKQSVQTDYVDAMARLRADHFSKISMVAVNPDGSISVKATDGARRLSIDILGFHEYAFAIFEKVDRHKYRTILRSKKIGQSEMLSIILNLDTRAVTVVESMPQTNYYYPKLASYSDHC